MNNSVDDNKYELAINELCDEYNITILHPKYKHMSGRAWLSIRSISIPVYMTTPYSFMVALHEINHVILNDIIPIADYKYTYLLEYEVERMTILLARSYEFLSDADIYNYTQHAHQYIVDIFNRENSNDELIMDFNVAMWAGQTRYTAQ